MSARLMSATILLARKTMMEKITRMTAAEKAKILMNVMPPKPLPMSEADWTIKAQSQVRSQLYA
jgi:hypothetical protein